MTNTLDTELGLIEHRIFADIDKAEARRYAIQRKAIADGTQCPVCCEACGRAMGKDGFEVNVVYGDMLAPRALWEDERVLRHAGQMGVYVIGPECGRAIPSAYKRRATIHLAARPQ